MNVPRSPVVRLPYSVALCLMMAGGCVDTHAIAKDSTTEMLRRGAPAMAMESDFDLAARAIPAQLKTIEGFVLADPGNRTLTALAAEGFCQYASGFIEDEWEQALVAGDLDAQLYQASRATKSYIRCMNYAMRLLPDELAAAIPAEQRMFARRLAETGIRHRDPLMWTAIGLAGAIDYGRRDLALVAQLPKAHAMLERVIELDAAHGQDDALEAALPHLVLGASLTTRSRESGGDPAAGREHFERARALTSGRLLLIGVYYARGYARITNDRRLFRSLLEGVLRSDPAIWPAQRLANEIAHRRARRYLKMEAQWF